MFYSLHPNPLLERPRWRSLEGTWQLSFDEAEHPGQVSFDREVQVPYAPESVRSGLHEQGYRRVVWYRRNIPLEATELGGRVLLHFEAVDYSAKVWANGQLVVSHQGGHTPFWADVTEAINGDSVLEVIVRAEDDPHDLHKPRGKQDWRPRPHSIWYPRTTGIWQTVWLESVPATRVGGLRWTPDLDKWAVQVEAEVAGERRDGLQLEVRLSLAGRTVALDRYAVQEGRVSRQIALSDPGIDDARDDWLWSPEHPQLIEAELRLLAGEEVLDTVRSYTALRSVAAAERHFWLNGRPYYLRLALDQGYWPEGLMTASDAELRREVESAKGLGFNGVRKHQKLESRRWLYWCDVLGLLVWDEMPSCYSFSPTAIARLTQEWIEVMRRDHSHPCVVAWVPFNESWGVPDLPRNPAQREYLRGLYHLTKALDPSRVVSANDGWEQPCSDLLTIHDYNPRPEHLLGRYGTPEAIAHSLGQVRPGGRSLTLGGFAWGEQPALLSEFGGIAFSSSPGDGWGYSRASDSQDFLEHYAALLGAVHQSTGLAGFCYTQLADTFQEKNGLLYADRTPKADLSKLAEATRGPRQSTHISNPLGYSRRWLEKQQPKIEEGV
ncbi:MAG: glycoside hydrolase family 2 TIM barrel-domain containing protein [Meiothermus sp.]|nr:glycoside hydrolase family 2 TIM barrel-domain containing protein [Meiothermus sp.]